MKMDLNFLKNKKIMLLGVGNLIRGDDALGSLVANELSKFNNEKFFAIDCSTSPENFIKKIFNFSPDVLILVDAIDLNLKPGEIKLIEVNKNFNNCSISTHKFSLRFFASEIKNVLNVMIYLIGTQAKKIKIGDKISKEVLDAKESIVREFKILLNKN